MQLPRLQAQTNRVRLKLTKKKPVEGSIRDQQIFFAHQYLNRKNERSTSPKNGQNQ